MQTDPYLPSFLKLNGKWVKDINIKPESLNIIEEKVGDNLELIDTRDNFLNRTPMAYALRLTINKCSTVNRIKWAPTEWERSSFNPIPNKINIQNT